MSKAQNFGERLKELRVKSDMTQRELANKVNVDFTYLSKIENGMLPPPSEKVILHLAEVLNADTDELITAAEKIPSDIAEILKNREALRLLRSDKTKKQVQAPAMILLISQLNHDTEALLVNTERLSRRNYTMMALQATI